MTDQHRYRSAIMLALATSLCSAFTNAIAKHLTGGYDPATIIFIRNLPMVLPLWLWLRHLNLHPKFTNEEILRHLPRALAGAISYGLLVFTVQNIPLADATAVSLSQPIFVAILAPLMLKEHVSREKWFFVLAGFIGVLLIVKPTGDIPTLSALLIMLHPIFFALVMISVRFLGRTENPWITVFYYALFSSIFSAPWAVTHLPDDMMDEFPYLAALVILTLLLQYTQAKSLELAEASTIAPVYYSSIVWGLIIAYFIWNEWPDNLAWVGISLIIGTGLGLKFLTNSRKIPTQETP